jgi:2'-5' RNA ligase
MRLFIALETPLEIREALVALRDRLAESRADVRWEAGEKLHATLKFLGETAEPLLPEIRDALERIGTACPPVRTRYRSVGAFPTTRTPRVVWAGMDDTSGDLADLAGRLEEVMAGLGFRREERPFHPHITLGRVRGQGSLDRLRSLMESVTFDGPPVVLHEMRLVKSVLRPGGSQYSTLHSVPLVGNRAGTR